MIVPDAALAISANAIASTVFKALTARKAFVRFYALVMATTAVVCVTVKEVTKVLNVKSQLENVKCLGALGMDVALKANAIVSAVSKDMTALNLTVWTRHALHTAHASMANVTAKLDGRAKIVAPLINKFINACPDVRNVALTI